MDPNSYMGQHFDQQHMHPPNMMPQQMYYQQPDQGYSHPMPEPSSVNFASFQPDPNVLTYPGQPHQQQPYIPPSGPPQMNMLQHPPPMPLLPTEPLPELNPNLQISPSKSQPQSTEKSKTPKGKRKSCDNSPAAAKNIPAKKIPEFVKSLLVKHHEGYSDVDFAERALSNLARKIANQGPVIHEWKRAILEADRQSGCVCVSRPKDGRMTITKATGSAGCKKVFPQIFVCQVFRWPKIVFHHDIRSSNWCQHPRVIKPPIPEKGASKDESGGGSDDKELICINPYHYDLTTDAETRFKKQEKCQLNKAAAKATMMELGEPALTSDSEESDDEILHYDHDGVDYAQLWDSNFVKPANSDVHELKVEDMLKELNFFSLNKDLKKITQADPKVLEELGVLKELESVIKSGEYVKFLSSYIEQPKPPEPEVVVPKEKPSMSQQSDEQLMPPPKVSKDQGKPTEEDDDNAIQNLLDDIRGSFERQFDDDFNDLTDTSVNESEANSRTSSPFGNINIGPTFSMTDGHALEDLAASAEDLLASSPDEMPLEGWSMSQEVFDNFLNSTGATSASNQTDGQFNFPHRQPHQF